MEKERIVINKLTELKKEVSTMESCTGGGLANAFTSIEGSSNVLKFSAVTYSNEYKIKMGVNPDVIDKYTVYSKEVSVEMAKNIAAFSKSDYGIGITGKLNRIDEANPYGEDNVVFFTIYDKEKDKCYSDSLKVLGESRKVNKLEVIDKILDNFIEILNEEK